MYLNTISLISLLVLQSVGQWTSQTSGVTARLRGVSAVTDKVAWASGSGSTVLRTSDGGTSWHRFSVTADQVDFRDVDAVNEQTAYVLSIGNGPASRIYKTVDAGATWSLQFKNEDPKAFFDAMSFWDENSGIVFGDSIGGQFYLLLTSDGGKTWSRVPDGKLPPALDNEGAFAASGTNIAVLGKTHAWIGTGAASKSRVLRTTDRGKTWSIAETPIKSGASEGIFSIAFRDAKHGIVVGGDYRKENDSLDNAAITEDGGATWKLVKGLRGFRSVVAYVPGHKRTVVAIGPSGGDISTDDGNTWSKLDVSGADTFSFARGRSFGWAAGAKGILGTLEIRK